MDRMIDNLDIRNEPEEIVKFENREIRTASSPPKQDERSEKSSQRAIEREPAANKSDAKVCQVSSSKMKIRHSAA